MKYIVWVVYKLIAWKNPIKKCKTKRECTLAMAEDRNMCCGCQAQLDMWLRYEKYWGYKQ